MTTISMLAAESVRDWIPESLKRTGFLLEHWQWLGLLALSVLGILAERVVNVLIPALVRRFLRGRDLEVDRDTAKVGLRPFGILAMALVWMGLLPVLSLPGDAETVLTVAVRFFAAVAGVWAAYRLVDVGADVLKRRADRTKSRFDDLLVPLFRKSLKVFVTVVGLVFVASVMGVKVTSLLAGLGLGGLAFALAAQDTVKNLFGSITVILDRPFHVGDWVLIGNQEGTVEEVGFRTTRLRTFYNSLISIPNGNLISATVDNMGARRYRRVKATLSLTYDTPPERVEAFCEGVRELLRLHPYTRKDVFHVYLNAFGASSIDVLLYCFVRVPDWGTELREKHRLFLDVLRIARRVGVEFAFPTQTIHLAKDEEAPAGEPAGPSAAEVDRAFEAGREEARAIVRALLGDPPRTPPPVSSPAAEPETRGEA